MIKKFDKGNCILTESQYLPSVAIFRALIYQDTWLIDTLSMFQKSGFRNRCRIATSQAVQTLTVPVKGGRGVKLPMCEVEIDHSFPWKKLHLEAIKMNYLNSPFFEYYFDDLAVEFAKPIQSLVEFNGTLIRLVLQMLEWDLKVELLDSIHLMSEFQDLVIDNEDFTIYPQVFDSKIGFQKNLSIIDLLFNEGPEATRILRNH
jgi:hypothetical protein